MVCGLTLFCEVILLFMGYFVAKLVEKRYIYVKDSLSERRKTSLVLIVLPNFNEAALDVWSINGADSACFFYNVCSFKIFTLINITKGTKS